MNIFKRYLSLFLLSGVIAGSLLSLSHNALADEGQNSDLSIEETALSETHRIPCPVKDAVIKNRLDNGGVTDRTVSACSIYNDDVDLIFYRFDDGGSYIAIRAKGSSSAYIPIKDFSTMEQLRYSSGTLTFLDWRRRDVIAIDDFLKSYEPKFYDSAGEVVEYTYKSDTIHAIGGNVSSYAISSSQRYLMTNNSGFYYILDRSTNDSFGPIRINGDDFWGGEVNTDAVSDDGRYLFIGSESLLIDLGDCNDFRSESTDRGSQVLGRCKIINLNRQIKNIAGYAPYSIEPQFIYRGNNVLGVEFETAEFTSFTRGANGIEEPRKHFKAWFSDERPEEDNKHIEYLALGDSYSSGEGDIEQDEKGNPFYIVNGDINCHLSSRAYPFLLRDAWSLDDKRMKSIACSGALVTKDYTMSLADYPGQHDELTKLPSTTTREDYINITLDNFVPGRIPQVEFVKKYQPKVITLTGGGNDVGFADILTYCADDVLESHFGYTCEYVKGGKLHDILNDSIDSQYKPTRELIESLKNASPGSNIYYIGYPSFIAGSNATCALNNGALDDYERDMINESVTRLNGVIKQATADTGVQYVDIEDALHGGRLCEGSDYMTGIWDAGVSNTVFGHVPQEVFHPNSRGQEKISEKILKTVNKGGVDYQPTEPKTVTIQPGIKTSRARIVKDDTIPEGEMLEIELRPGTSAGSSDIVVPAFSNEVLLGIFKSKPDGSLNASVRLPKELTPGHHLILLNFTAPNGEQERVYQFITVLAVEPRKYGLDESNNHVESISKHKESTGYLTTNIANEPFHPYSQESAVLDAEMSSTKYGTSYGASHEDKENKNSSYIAKVIGILLALGIIGGGVLYVKKYKI